MTTAKKKNAKRQTNVLLGDDARHVLKTLATTLMPIKLSESNVIEILLLEEAKRRDITLPS